MSNVIDLITGQPYQTGLEIIQDLSEGLVYDLASTAGINVGYRQDVTMTYNSPRFYQDDYQDIFECLAEAQKNLRMANMELNNLKAMMERFNELPRSK